MTLESLKKKIFGRKATNIELSALTIGIVAGSMSILSQLGFLSITSIKSSESILNPITFFTGLILSGLIIFYISRKQKDNLVLWSIFILGGMILLGAYSPLATIFNPTGELGKIPLTMNDCREIGGIIVTINNDCPNTYYEIGGKDNFICCSKIQCEKFERVWNPETELYEKLCIDS